MAPPRMLRLVEGVFLDVEVGDILQDRRKRELAVIEVCSAMTTIHVNWLRDNRTFSNRSNIRIDSNYATELQLAKIGRVKDEDLQEYLTKMREQMQEYQRRENEYKSRRLQEEEEKEAFDKEWSYANHDRKNVLRAKRLEKQFGSKSGVLINELIERANGYDVAGRRLPRDEIKELLGISDGTFRHRMNIRGAPANAMMMSRKRWEELSVRDSFFLGWQYWCEKAGIPTDEKDIIVDAAEEYTSLCWWSPKNREGGEDGFEARRILSQCTRVSSGVCSFLSAISNHYSDPRAVMSLWLQAVIREYDVCLYEEGRAEFPSLREPFLDAHYLAKTFLPSLETVGQSVYEEHQSLRLICEGSQDRTDHEVTNNFDFIGFVVWKRQQIRSKYRLRSVSSLTKEAQQEEENYRRSKGGNCLIQLTGDEVTRLEKAVAILKEKTPEGQWSIHDSTAATTAFRLGLPLLEEKLRLK